MAAVEEVVVGERKGGGSVEREHGEGGLGFVKSRKLYLGL